VSYFETELHNKSAKRAWAILVLAGVDQEAFYQKSSDSKSRGEYARCCGPHDWRFEPGTDGRRIDDDPCEEYGQSSDDAIIQIHRVLFANPK
jgi:hypothetical protein